MAARLACYTAIGCIERLTHSHPSIGPHEVHCVQTLCSTATALLAFPWHQELLASSSQTASSCLAVLGSEPAAITRALTWPAHALHNAGRAWQGREEGTAPAAPARLHVASGVVGPWRALRTQRVQITTAHGVGAKAGWATWAGSNTCRTCDWVTVKC